MTNIKKDFFKYVIPSVIGMLVSALYIVVDGIFVGRGVGAEALGAVNITLPYISLLTAFTMMVTMGGCTLMSIQYGLNDFKKGNDIFIKSMSIVILISISISIGGILFSKQLSLLLGASQNLLPLSRDYMSSYLIFGIFFCLSLSLSAFVRNDNNPKLAMISLIIGALSNIILDYLFIFKFDMGIKGAAIASGLGQIFSLIVLSTHFILKKGNLKLYLLKIKLDDCINILKTGTPELIVQLASPVNILVYNIVISQRIGDLGVSSFGIIGYLITILIALFIGVSQGVQPLLSFYHGKEDSYTVNYLFKLAIKTNFILSLIIYLTLFIFGELIVGVFTTEPQLIDFTSSAIKIYFLSFVIASINIVYINYLLATEQTRYANIVSFNRGITFNILTIMILPFMLGNTGIWISIVLCEVLGFILANRIVSRTLDISLAYVYNEKNQ